MEAATLSRISLAGLAVMGQNLALNIAEKGFPISVYNRTTSKVGETLNRAHNQGHLPLTDHYTPRDFVLSIQKPRSIIILVKPGAPVDQTIAALSAHMEPRDTIIDGGNEWYENTERRNVEANNKGLLYLEMGVSGGEEGARNGNFVKMVHNGIEYGDMQLISEAYDVLKNVGGLSNSELAEIFYEWNKGELESFLIEITADKSFLKVVVSRRRGATGREGGRWWWRLVVVEWG